MLWSLVVVDLVVVSSLAAPHCSTAAGQGLLLMLDRDPPAECAWAPSTPPPPLPLLLIQSRAVRLAPAEPRRLAHRSCVPLGRGSRPRAGRGVSKARRCATYGRQQHASSLLRAVFRWTRRGAEMLDATCRVGAPCPSDATSHAMERPWTDRGRAGPWTPLDRTPGTARGTASSPTRGPDGGRRRGRGAEIG